MLKVSTDSVLNEIMDFLKISTSWLTRLATGT